jgi:hypothetical protein
LGRGAAGGERAEEGRGREAHGPGATRPGGRAAKGEGTRGGREREAHLGIQNPAITVNRIT